MNYIGRLLSIIFLSANVTSFGMYVRRGTQATRNLRTPTTQIAQPQRPTFTQHASSPTLAERLIPTALYNWWYGQQQQPTQMRSTALEETAARKPGQPFIQKRKYQSSTIPQASESWMDKLTSWFEPMTTEKLNNKMYWLVDFRAPQWKSPNGEIYRHHRIFKEEQLEKAKKLVDQYKELINGYTEIKWDYNFYRNTRNYSLQIDRNCTILDLVLSFLLAGDFNHFSYFVSSDSALNLLKLVHYIRDKGGIINPNRAQLYKYAYIDFLFKSLERQYAGGSQYGADYELPILRQLLKELYQLFVLIIPGFDQDPEVQKIKEEVMSMEQDPEQYKRKTKDKINREEYLREKQRYSQFKWSQRTGIDPYDSYQFRDQWENVSFDEKEYQQWLKNKFSTFFFHMAASQGHLNDQPKIDFFTLIGLDPKSSPSEAEVKRAYGTTVKMKHPDTNPDLKSGAISVEQANQQFNELYTAREKYELWKQQTEEVANQRASE